LACRERPGSSIQLRVLSLRFPENRDVGVGVLPEGEEVLVRLAASIQVAGQRMGAAQPELRAPTEVTGSTIEMLKDTCGNLIQITQLARW